jgi:hypothetical protein
MRQERNDEGFVVIIISKGCQQLYLVVIVCFDWKYVQ